LRVVYKAKWGSARERKKERERDRERETEKEGEREREREGCCASPRGGKNLEHRREHPVPFADTSLSFSS
jgi:hypothetical protein